VARDAECGGAANHGTFRAHRRTGPSGAEGSRALIKVPKYDVAIVGYGPVGAISPPAGELWPENRGDRARGCHL